MQVNWYKEGAMIWRVPQRQYLDITLTGDTTTDKIKMDFGQLYTRQIMKTKDTVLGLRFHFGEQCPYWVFVAALNLCNIEDVLTYSPSDEGLYIYNHTRAEDERASKQHKISSRKIMPL